MNSTKKGAEGVAPETSSVRAMIRDQIRNEAEKQPDAVPEELADHLPWATPDLVENVLASQDEPHDETAGDKEAEQAVDESCSANDPGTAGFDEQDEHDLRYSQTDPLDRSELTEKQVATLRAISDHPDATQTALADQFGIAPATLNARVNSIDGFDWQHRQTFVDRLFDPDPEDDSVPEDPDPDPPSGQELNERTDEPTDRLQTIEKQRSSGRSHPLFSDPELGSNILHACLQSSVITEEEEVELLREALRDPEFQKRTQDQ